MCQRGFPVAITNVQKIAYHYVKVLHRQKQCAAVPESWKKNSIASIEWWYGFSKGHADMTLRVAENISTVRAEPSTRKV